MDIWDCIPVKEDVVPWYSGVWLKSGVTRYVFHSGLLCHGRINTLARLGGVRGIEKSQHFFISCAYSGYILRTISTGNMGIVSDSSLSWQELVVLLLNMTDRGKAKVAVMAAQIFAYHIWRERNVRLHNKGILNPRKLIGGILEDLQARLHSSTWFTNLICSNRGLYIWIP